MTNHYDAIIIGGRNAGSSLAMRLAKQNLKVLLVDRANFPSLPQVPSSPIIHAGTMRLMDELGFDEKEYTHPDGLITEYVLTFIGHFQAFIPTELMNIDRNYGYGIDRNRFDTVLWERAAQTPNVTACANFSATEIQKENGRVTGIVGKDGQGQEVRATADIVVGADGRFSWTARAVDAKILEERNEYMGTSYHAEWENVAPISPEHPHTVGFYNTAKGVAVLTIPIDTRKYIVATYMTTAKANFGSQKLEGSYMETLQSIPEVAARLKNAKKVTDVVGVKGIQNGYRTPYGNGWALVGDAVHYKDPVDGQGIYDALLGTKILAQAIQKWKQENYSWDEAMKFYQDELWKATHTMFLQTVERIKQELYSEPPPFIIKTIIRWTMTDPEYQAGFLRYIFRAIDPSERPTPHPKFFLRGMKRDLLGS
jgi:2-polyprenyl-6-methoxyphenol hydroxylase-like FAD-dependent oxidoreductase